ncbi:MAG: CHAT domain-containing tetratricopeptide repeat protein [Bacteroidota bacterium]
MKTLKLISLTLFKIMLLVNTSIASENNQYHNLADSLRHAGLYKEANTVYQQAITAYQQEKDTAGVLFCAAMILENKWKMGNLQQALTYADSLIGQTEKLPEKWGKYQSSFIANKSTINIYIGKFDEGLKYARSSLKLRQRLADISTEEFIGSYMLLGAIFNAMHQYDSAEYYMLNAINLTKTELDNDPNILSKLYNNLGAFYHHLDNQKSVEYLTEAARLYTLVYGENHISLQYPYLNIGSAQFNLGEYRKSIENYLKGMEIVKVHYGQKSLPYAQFIINLGNSFLGLRQYDSARYYLREALEIFTNQGGENNYRVADICMILGKLEFEDNQPKLGLAYHSKAIDIYHQSTGVKSFRLANLYKQLSEHYENKGEYIRSLEYAQKSLISLVPDFNETELSKNPVNLSSTRNVLLVYMLSKKAELLSEQNKVSPSPEYRSIIEEMLELIMSLEKYVSNEVVEENSYHSTVSNLNDYVNSIGIRLNFDFNFPNSKEKAFQFSELNKSLMLRKSSSAKFARQLIKVSDDLSTSDTELQQNISFYRSKLMTEKTNLSGYDSAKVSEYEAKLFDLKRQKEAFIAHLESKHPQYYNLKHNTNTIAISTIQNELLRKNQAIVEYFMTDESLFAFVIDQENFQIKEIPLPDNFNEDTQSFNNAIRNSDLSAYSETAFRLYQTVFQPIESLTDRKEIIIVPDGILWQINFDLLLSASENESDYRSLPYLIKDYTFSYAYSATLLYQEKQRKLEGKMKMLAFGFNNEDSLSNQKIEGLTTLAGSKAEIDVLSNLFEGTFLTGSSANEQNFKNNAPQYKMLHLALHGKLDEEDAENSLLQFNVTQDSLEDGRLHNHELYDTRLNAELAVLSACDTGAGSLLKGEGIISMGRAFMFAGCKSIVLSLWPLKDAVAPNIMQDFYSQLREGKNKSESLRNAKLNYLNTADNLKSNPYYWGSLVIIGNGDAMEFEPTGLSPILWTLLIIGLLLLLVIFKKKKFNTANWLRIMS